MEPYLKFQQEVEPLKFISAWIILSGMWPNILNEPLFKNLVRNSSTWILNPNGPYAERIIDHMILLFTPAKPMCWRFLLISKSQLNKHYEITWSCLKGQSCIRSIEPYFSKSICHAHPYINVNIVRKGPNVFIHFTFWPC